MQLDFKGTTPRHPLWGRDQFIEDLKKYRIVKHVCSIYALDNQTWFTYYADVWRWRRQDPKFDKQVKAILGQSEDAIMQGRPPKDGGDKSWHEDFCNALYKHDGNRAKAATKTPYSLRQINEMLDPMASSFDEEFSKKVQEVIAKIAAELEEMFLSLRHDSNYRTFNDAKIAQTKGWIAVKALENLDPTRWGKKSQVNVSGTIDHRHRVERVKSRDEILTELWDDRQRFIESRKQQMALQSGIENQAIELPRQEEEILEAEVISNDGIRKIQDS